MAAARTSLPPVRTSSVGVAGPGFGGHFVRLDVRFVPEPAWALALASAALGLALLARGRFRRSHPRSNGDELEHADLDDFQAR